MSTTTSDPANSKTQTRYLSESVVQPFLADNFSPADFLNDSLPQLSSNAPSVRSSVNGHTPRAVPLPDLNVQLQTLLSQLNAQTSRLSTTLTQLSDEIIRSGGRLAYEVELLGADTTSLNDVLNRELKKDIELFTVTQAEKGSEDAATQSAKGDDHLDRLKQLTLVRSRLDEVVKVFGEAMSWPIAPSELSLASSLISVSAPDDSNDGRSREEKGKEYADSLRRDINELVGAGNDMASLQTAANRIEGLRQLAQVWKGTSEEKARIKFVESLASPIEERQKLLERTRRAAPSTRAPDYRYGPTDMHRSDGGYGFLQNLRQLRNEG